MYRQKLLFIFSLTFISQLVYAQQNITGTVKDGNDVAILGATIVIKGTAIKAVSDVDGAFSLETQSSPPYTLSISSVGYRTREVQVPSGRTSPVEVVLFADDFQL